MSMNREDKSIPKVIYEITFWMTFLYREASRCTSADCKLFFNSLTSPFLFDSLKNVVVLVDMLNLILNCRNVVHLTSLDKYHSFNPQPILTQFKFAIFRCKTKRKHSFLKVKCFRASLIFPARDTTCYPTWGINYAGTVSNLPQPDIQAWLYWKETETKLAAFNSFLVFCKVR